MIAPWPGIGISGSAAYWTMPRNPRPPKLIPLRKASKGIAGLDEISCSRTPTVRLRLYVAGNAPNSMQARRNLALICEEHLAGRCDLEVIDIYLEPARALSDSIFMTPTLLQLAPRPQRTIVGALSQTQDVLLALDLAVA